MIHLAVLYIGECLADELMHGLLLLHGGYVQILAHIVDAVYGTDHAGGARAEQFQQLQRRTEPNSRSVCKSKTGREAWSTYASLVEQLADHGHGEDTLAHLELAPLSGHGQNRVARDARQYEAIQGRGNQFLFWKKKRAENGNI